MQRFKNYAIWSLTIALLVLSTTTSSQMQEPPAPSKPASKFVKAKNPFPNRYVVVLNDDVVSDKDPLEVRRAGVTAIANRHAQTYGGTADRIYETTLKGYEIQLPNEAAAIAISKLPQVKWVEEHSMAGFFVVPPFTGSLKTPVCRGKTVAVSLLERPFGRKVYGRRLAYLTGGISQRTRLVIRDRGEFNELWEKIWHQASDKPSLPEVDFSRQMLIVAAMGSQQSAYEIIVDSACEVDNQLEVLVRSTKFLPCGAYAGMLPETVDIVGLPKTDLPVVFRETEATVDCKGVIVSGG